MGCSSSSGRPTASAEQAPTPDDSAPKTSKGSIICYKNLDGSAQGSQHYAVVYDDLLAYRYDAGKAIIRTILPGAEPFLNTRSDEHAQAVKDRADWAARPGASDEFESREHFACWCFYGVHVKRFPLTEDDPAARDITVEEPASTPDDPVRRLVMGAIIRYEQATAGGLPHGSARWLYHYAVVFDATSALAYNGEMVAAERIRRNPEEFLTPRSIAHARLIVRRALGRVGETKYSRAFNNCEHFATWCYCGESYSKQAKVCSLSAPKYRRAYGLPPDEGRG